MNDAFFPNTPDPSPAEPRQTPSASPDFIYTTDASPAPVRTAAKAGDIRYLFGRLGLSMLVLSIGMMLATYAIDYGLYYLIPGYATAWWRTWVLSLVPLYGVGLPLMLLSLRGVEVAPHNTDYQLGLTVAEKPRFKVKHWLMLLIIAFGCMYVGNIIGTFIMFLLTVITGFPYANGLESMITESPLWATFIGSCICAPLGEEFIFRKLLIDRSRRFGDTVSILLSGFFFGLFHSNLFQFFYAFFLGVILAYIYTRTGKLRWCVAMHAVINFVGGVLMSEISALLPEDSTTMMEMTATQSLITFLLSLWTYGTIIAGIVLLACNVKRRRLSPGRTPLYLKKSAYYVMLNPGMLANFIVMCFMMAINLIPTY